MRFEHKKGSLHAAHVARAFVRAIRATLPQEAFAELDLLPMQPDSVENWADAHGINAPCVVQEFACFCAGGWTDYRHFEGDGWQGPEIPQEWLQRVGSLNARPIDPWAWRGVYADEFLLTEVGRGKVVPGVDPDVVRKAFDRHLGPIATDPSRESWEDFQIRARFHWIARVQEAKSFGFRPAGRESEWPNLPRDIRWLVRHQVNKETLEDIAGPQDRDNAIDPDTVKKAIDRLSRVIGLKRKRGRRVRMLRKPLK